MNRFYLTLTQSGFNTPRTVRVCAAHDEALKEGRLVRTSPIYQVFPATETAVPLDGGCGHILFLFTLDSFVVLGMLKQRFEGDKLLHGIYVSHGLASVLVFSHDSEQFPAILTALQGHVKGHEIWRVHDSRLVDQLPKPILLRSPSPERNRPWAIPCADGFDEALHRTSRNSLPRKHLRRKMGRFLQQLLTTSVNML